MHKSSMKLVFVCLLSMAIFFPAQAASNHHVRGYVKKNGAYVEPHRQTNPNHTQRDNWSAKGNANPFTAKSGKKEPRK